MTRPPSPHICSDNCHDFKSMRCISRDLKQLECLKCKYQIIMRLDGNKCNGGADHEYSAKRGKDQYIKKLVCRVCLHETTVKIDLDDHWIQVDMPEEDSAELIIELDNKTTDIEADKTVEDEPEEEQAKAAYARNASADRV